MLSIRKLIKSYPLWPERNSVCGSCCIRYCSCYEPTMTTSPLDRIASRCWSCCRSVFFVRCSSCCSICRHSSLFSLPTTIQHHWFLFGCLVSHSRRGPWNADWHWLNVRRRVTRTGRQYPQHKIIIMAFFARNKILICSSPRHRVLFTRPLVLIGNKLQPELSYLLLSPSL